MNNAAMPKILDEIVPREAPIKEARFTFPLILLCLYVIVEYGRPPFLDALRPALVLQVILVVLLMKNWASVKIVLRERYFKLFFLLLLLMLIHIPTATNNYWALMQWELMVSYLIFSLSFCAFIADVGQLKTILIVFILTHVLGAISRLLNSGAFGGTGPLGDQNDFALAMDVVIPLAFYIGLFYTGKKRIAFWIAAILFVIANVSTMSRGGFVGMAVVAFFIGMQSRNKAKALVALMSVVIIFFTLVPDTYKTELESIQADGTQQGTSRDRIELWKVAWRMFLANPILGVGQGNLQIMFEKYQYDDKGNSYWNRGMWGRAVHSIYLTLLAELGVTGTLLWLLMVKDYFNRYRFLTEKNLMDEADMGRRKLLDNIGRGLWIGLLGYLTGGVFLSAFYYPYFWNLLSFMIAANIVQGRNPNKRESQHGSAGFAAATVV